MELHVKYFNDLTVTELYELLRLRTEVFVVEQNCAYQDIDSRDLDAIHVWLTDGDEVTAYLRVLKPGVSYDEAALGRIVTRRRMAGLGREIMSAGIDIVRNTLHENRIVIGAQVQAKGFYEKLGFRRISEPYLEDDIPHIKMILELSADE